MQPQRAKRLIVPVIIGGLILSVIIAAYRFGQPQVIPFVVVEEGYSLIGPTGFPRQEPDPPLIVIASPEAMTLPSMLAFPEPLAERLKQVDFSESFVVLVHRGHPNRGLVKEVTRQQEKVVITTYDVTGGPGNYVIEGWTQPYEFIRIDKQDKWSRQIRFVLQRETQGVLGEAVHFIP